MTLESALRKAATSGRIAHLTLAPTATGKWQGAVRLAGRTGYEISFDADPVEALKKALLGEPWMRARNSDIDEILG